MHCKLDAASDDVIHIFYEYNGIDHLIKISHNLEQEVRIKQKEIRH